MSTSTPELTVHDKLRTVSNIVIDATLGLHRPGDDPQLVLARFCDQIKTVDRIAGDWAAWLYEDYKHGKINLAEAQAKVYDLARTACLRLARA